MSPTETHNGHGLENRVNAGSPEKSGPVLSVEAAALKEGASGSFL